MKLSIEAPENEVALPGEVHVHIRFRPANFVGILLVLLIHALLLYFLLNMHPVRKKGDNGGPQNPIFLILDKTNIAKLAVPEAKKSVVKPAHTVRRHKAPAPPVVAKEAIVVPPVTPPVAETAPAMDMMSMLQAARERRRAAEAEASRENESAEQASRGMSPQEVAEANVRHSMQRAAGRDGTNGVFEVLSKSTRMATFSFRGWNPNSNNRWKQVIEVDAGLGGNVELAIVRRMIELIRTHYQGNFNWESRRLGRVITLSARPQDSAELEAFMMKEFFG